MAVSAKFLKKFNDFKLDVEFSMGNETLVFFGPSGAGKSLTLKLLSGLICPDQGILKINDQEVFNSESKINVRPQDRSIGYVFQNHSLFPHMTVEQNILFGAKGAQKSVAYFEMKEMLHTFHLESLEKKYPREISGGQEQRVALAMTLIRKPKLLLLDEPFSALDNHLRTTMRESLKEVKEKFNIPIIFVTHDEGEANFLGNRILVFKNGKIIEEKKGL